MHSFNFASDELAQHVVIAGGGRIGMQIAKILHGLRIPFVIIELDQRLVEMAKEAGFKVVFGDASQTVVLEAANTARAVLLVVSIPGGGGGAGHYPQCAPAQSDHSGGGASG